jgi:hypothetical protein
MQACVCLWSCVWLWHVCTCCVYVRLCTCVCACAGEQGWLHTEEEFCFCVQEARSCSGLCLLHVPPLMSMWAAWGVGWNGSGCCDLLGPLSVNSARGMFEEDT